MQRLLLLALAGGLAAAAPARAEVTAENFRGGRTADLVALCGDPAGDRNHTAALAYCHGFLVAAAQYHASTTGLDRPLRPVFCVPNPQPTLNQVTESFVRWAQGNPQHNGEKAIDGVMRFAAATYPCPAH